ncbi:PREDICTED: mannosyl-oligosaccharide glucosidase [Nicrophorus vespilloides]|uniref:Mannosyl-oligosaccharide glucosidase n=1 Tax=Nicrophorus vespilloides TaxID=110193 RepID=A0ABM1N9D8_NICVS|nr:PREDICTED: mannosyl-oligosaccharide glucosidase [Nicrophorus vespilloides]
MKTCKVKEQNFNMVRQRRVEASKADKGTNSSSSNGSTSVKPVKDKKTILSYWKQYIGFLCFIFAAAVGYMGYLETRVNTPYDDKKIVIQSGLDIPDRFWGSYRPGTYFGFKTRDPHSLVTGLMWYFPKRLRPGGDGIRHWCEQGDNLDKYGWIQHDATSFGVQEIHDGPFLLTTSFVKRLGGLHGGDWTARISVEVKPEYAKKLDEEVSLLWYTAFDENIQGYIKTTNTGSELTGIRGDTPGLGKFNIKMFNHSGSIEHESYLSTVAPGLNLLKETVISSLRLAQDNPKSPRKVVLAGELMPASNSRMEPNFIATQITAKLPFTLDVVFESGSVSSRENMLAGDVYTQELQWQRLRFNQRFEDTFNLQEKGYKTREIQFAQAALSNMLGGIGYFYGTSRVQSSYTKDPVPYWKASLYTGVPSRSFFPRGFLWDEGFHGFLISTWDLDIELDIMSHWFDLMNVEGWIPREQILGVEALAKVPEEFVTQRNSNANPPTFFLTLQHILRNHEKHLTNKRLATLERLYPRLQAWFAWFNNTQKGEVSGSYRWRGRDPFTNRELNPKTLTSGLDDYPRSSHPSDDERHIDLRCWIAIAADTIGKLAVLLGEDGYKYDQTAAYLKDEDLMNALHWSEYSQSYADYGLHTDAVILKRPKQNPRAQTQNLEMVRVITRTPEYRLVDNNFGYVSLFPFLLQILDENSPRLSKILNNLDDPNLLWTPYGLRSLAKSSPLYMKRNTEHDPPYWRGQIWINMNFLSIRALHYYAEKEGPYQKKAFELYNKLRSNVINNVINQYYKTGYVWEQYNDKNGEGSGCKPFTGWSALVVLLMGEHY